MSPSSPVRDHRPELVSCASACGIRKLDQAVRPQTEITAARVESHRRTERLIGPEDPGGDQSSSGSERPIRGAARILAPHTAPPYVHRQEASTVRVRHGEWLLPSPR